MTIQELIKILNNKYIFIKLRGCGCVYPTPDTKLY